MVYPPNGSKAYVREMRTPPTPTCGHGTSLPYKIAQVSTSSAHKHKLKTLVWILT